MSTANGGSATNSTKRPRPVISCLECRRKKLKCDRTHPCQQCLKIGRPARCQYQPGSEPEVDQVDSPSAITKRARTHSLSNQPGYGVSPTMNGFNVGPTPQGKPGVIEDLQERVIRLEKALLIRNTQEESLSMAPVPSGSQENIVSVGAAQKLVSGGNVDSLVSHMECEEHANEKQPLTRTVSGCL